VPRIFSTTSGERERSDFVLAPTLWHSDAVPLNPNTRLGPYEIIAPLGAGGMGEVYRARDPRLGREVAIKVLPQHLSTNSEVRARFEREAKTISSLNHPHICTLFDVGREGDIDYLVMELVEGESLAQRLAKGPLAAGEVLKLGGQIADALDRAHRAGVVHRDLKPGNVMLTKSGAKLMDFGLARATGMAGQGGDSGVTHAALTQSPTIAAPLTAEGTLVGTFQYMSPEQLEGKEADARSDLWALGCVLYEMATGRRAFAGKSQASLIASIMHTDPAPPSQVSPMTPPALDQLVRGMLAKDPEERIQTAHDVKLQLGWIAGSGSQSGAMPIAPRRRRVPVWTMAAIGALAALAISLTIALAMHPAGLTHTMRLTLLPPEAANVSDEQMFTAISPDGRHIAFIATDSTGSSQMWIRDLESSEAQPLPGTQQAYIPFWSPDSRFIAFFADGKLKKVDVDGKSVQVICDAPDGRGGAWSSRGVILFAPTATGPLMRVGQGGGQVTAATVLDAAGVQRAHRFPSFLGDGTHFLFVSLGDSMTTRIATLGNLTSRPILHAEGGSVYAAPGQLLFSRDLTLMVQRFDVGAAKLIGEPHALGPSPTSSSYAGSPPASVSANGIIVQRHRSLTLTALAWYDRGGRRLEPVPMAPGQYAEVALSPDGTRAAMSRLSSEGGSDIWTVHLASGLATRLSLDQTYCERPRWSPDGKWIAYSALVRPAGRWVYRRLSSGAGESEIYLKGPTSFTDPFGWTPDGRYFLYRDLDPVTGEDIWAVDETGDRKPFPVLHSRYHEEDASLSPDGKWLAYRSNESGRAELYLQSFPAPDARVRVSQEGAGVGSRSSFGQAYWRRDGRELIFVGGDGVTVMSVAIESVQPLRVGTPRPVFRLPSTTFDMVATPDLQRFLVLEPRGSIESASTQLILNWPAEAAAK
jgi:eukaryotic-like serine/threonine-protein kinase